MPYLTVNGARLYYEEHGKGEETIVFSHGLLWSSAMFQPQIEALKEHYRCIAYDHRGQGKSEVTPSGYDMETLYEDAVALIQALNAAPCHFVGLSMGGFVGMRIAIRRPELLRSLILIETTAGPEKPENKRKYAMLNFIARWFGLEVVADRVMPIMFGQKFMTDPQRAALRAEWRKRLVSNHRIGITRAVRGVIERQGVEDQLSKIKVPTLILVGDQDTATPPELSRKMQAAIAGSELVIIPGAGHSSTIEEPEAVTEAIQRFLQKQK